MRPKPRSEEGIYGRCYLIVDSVKFDAFIMVCILLNVVVMAFSYNGQSAGYALALNVLNEIFSLIFLVEMILKLTAFPVKTYVRDKWNVFDATIVMISVVTFILEHAVGGGATTFDPSLFRVFRIFRVLRILRLVKRAKGLKTLMSTLLFSMPALSNMGTLLLLILFIYAIMGMSLFGMVPTDKEFYNRHANFSTFFYSMLTLIRMVTGESWNGIMHDLYMDRDAKEVFITITYFLSFTFISAYIYINVLVAVVLKNFEDEVTSGKADDAPGAINRNDIISFGEWWMSITRMTYVMKASSLRAFMLTVPVGNCFHIDVKQLTKAGRYLALLKKLNIPVDKTDARVHWLDVCLALVAYNLWPNKDPLVCGVDQSNEMLIGVKASALRSFPELRKHKKFSYTIAHWFAASFLQKRWRLYNHRRKKLENKVKEQSPTKLNELKDTSVKVLSPDVELSAHHSHQEIQPP